MDVFDFLADRAGLSREQILSGLVRITTVDGHPVFAAWDVPGVDQPSEADLQSYVDGTAAPTKGMLRRYAAAVRYEHETAGVDVGGSTVATDRESQSLINGAFALSNANPDLTISFKAADGTFAQLDASGIQAIAMQVAEHVQACFAKEGQLSAGIDAGTITTTAQIESAFAGIA